MKVPPARAAAFLADPGAARVVLLYGEDEGLVRERADALTRTVAGASDDPFRVAWLAREDHERLAEEASAISMLGGRRVVRVRDALDSLTEEVASVLRAPGDSLVVLEAGGLTKRSKLLAAVEAAGNGAALAAYPAEGADLRAQLARMFERAGVRPDADALDWLQDHLGGDQATLRNEVEKLALYAGPGGRLDLDAVRDCVGDQAATSMEAAVYAVTLGDTAGADRSVERAFAEGTSPVGLLRVLLSHLTRMHLARGRLEAGAAAEAAVKALRPPVFWKREKDMTRSVEAWPLARVSAAMAEVRRVELACKQTGAPDLVMVRRLFLALSRRRGRSEG